jgi:hypothetical protein
LAAHRASRRVAASPGGTARRARRFLGSLACAAAVAFPAGATRAQQPAEPAPWEWPPDPWSVMLHLSLGGGAETGSPGSAGAGMAGFELLVRVGTIAAGPLLDASVSSGRESVWYGLAAGLVLEPRPWARLELLADCGVHDLGLESQYASQPTVRAQLPFLGARAGAYLFTRNDPLARGRVANRVGVGLQVGVRGDLGHATLQPSVPPELPPATPEVMGGLSLAVTLVLVLEW